MQLSKANATRVLDLTCICSNERANVKKEPFLFSPYASHLFGADSLFRVSLTSELVKPVVDYLFGCLLIAFRISCKSSFRLHSDIFIDASNQA